MRPPACVMFSCNAQPGLHSAPAERKPATPIAKSIHRRLILENCLHRPRRLIWCGGSTMGRGDGAMTMSSFTDPFEFLEGLRTRARLASRADSSRTYLQWLDHLSEEYGFTYTALKRKIESLDARLCGYEDEKWRTRLDGKRCWGRVPYRWEQTWPIPTVPAGEVAWVDAFAESALFTVNEGPRRELAGTVFRLDQLSMQYYGEELRVDSDQPVLMALTGIASGTRCGQVIEASHAQLSEMYGCELDEMFAEGPLTVQQVLWRLSNSRLVFDKFSFDGPLLSFVAIRPCKTRYRIAFNPAFANFYYPVLRLFFGDRAVT